jgi:hypothetical protein
MPLRSPRISEEQRRDLTVRQGNLTALANHPSWPTLEAEVQRKKQLVEKRVLSMTLGSGRFSEAEIAFHRGFIAGMRWFTDAPAAAEQSLEDYLRKQGMVREETLHGNQ